jgi:hypothetical protein
MTAVLCAGGELESVVFSGFAESTQGGSFDATYSRCALTANVGVYTWQQNFIDATGAAVTVGTGHTLYTHLELYTFGVMNAAGRAWSINDAAGNPWVALRPAGSATCGLYYNSGTIGSPVWTLLGSTFSFTAAIRRPLDIKLTLGSPHTIEFSLSNNVTVAATTFTQASFTAAGSHGGSGVVDNLGIYVSQMMATDGLSTIGGHCAARAATGAGTTSGWTGAASDINELALNDSTAITAATNGLVSTFAYADVTVPSSYYIPAVFLYSRFKNSGVAPNNVQAACHSGGSDFFSGNLPGVGTSFVACGYQWALEPSGSVAWTQTSFNAAEFGVKAIT